MSINNWFINRTSSQATSSIQQPNSPTVLGTSAPAIPGITAGLTKQMGQTYSQWGHQICAAAQGVLTTLTPYLQCAYNYSYQEQSRNVIRQTYMQNQLQGQIAQKKIELQTTQQKLGNLQTEIQNCQNEIDRLRKANYEKNKEAWAKFLIGLVIILPLTLYLFLFYSSTFYSAFFKDFAEDGGGLFQAMFDPRAIPASFQNSVFQGLFVLCAPIIFLGLGFALHFFSKQEGFGKYIKCGAMVLVTFAFDCILAYKIGNALYELGRTTGEIPLNAPEYSINLAITDTNIWAVIFCGFVVYIIWGILFDMIMDAYNRLDLNKIEIKALEDKINVLKQRINVSDGVYPGLLTQEANLKGEIAKLEQQLNVTVFIDYQTIKTDVTSFLTGWINCMAILQLPDTLQQQAQNIGMNYISSIK